MLQPHPAECHRPVARELDTRIRERPKQILDDVDLVPKSREPGPRLFVVETACDARKIGFELDGVFDAGRLLPPRGWLPTFQSFSEDLIDLRTRHRSQFAALVPIPGRVGLFELPPLRVGQLALGFDMVEMLADQETEGGRFAEIALLREAT